MAKTRGEITVADLKRLAVYHDLQAIVVVAVERDGVVRTVTYGETVAKCKAIGTWAQGWMGAALSKLPFRTVFGWGNSGVPCNLTSEELGSLSSNSYRTAVVNGWLPGFKARPDVKV